MRARTKRLYAVGAASVLVLAAIGIAALALGRHADLFYTPELLIERGMPELGQRVRIGGFVEKGSLVYDEGATVLFTIIDGSEKSVPVAFEGIPPDLFREEQGVVATGKFDESYDLFVASDILAKHDENYQPRELEGVTMGEGSSYEYPDK